MTSSTMRAPASSKKMVADHLKASEAVVRRVTKTQKSARAYLVKVGYLTKGGKLARAYRTK